MNYSKWQFNLWLYFDPFGYYKFTWLSNRINAVTSVNSFLGTTNLHGSQTYRKNHVPFQHFWGTTNLHGSQTASMYKSAISFFWGTTNLHGSQTRGLHEAFIIHFWGTTNLHDSQTLKYCCKPFGYYKFTWFSNKHNMLLTPNSRWGLLNDPNIRVGLFPVRYQRAETSGRTGIFAATNRGKIYTVRTTSKKCMNPDQYLTLFLNF